MPLPRRTLAIFLAALCLLGLVAGGAPSYRHGAAFVVIAAGMDGPARRIAVWNTTTVTAMQVGSTPWRGGTLRSRAYRPATQTGRAILLVPGVHAAGIDEPRLVGFARDLASMGHPVLTVELQDLTH